MAKLAPVVIGTMAAVVVGFILCLVGIFTPGWVKNQGLFQACSPSECFAIDLDRSAAFYRATAALEIIAFIATLATVGCVLVYGAIVMMGKAVETIAIVPKVVLGTSIVAGVFAIIGCIIFAAEMYDLYDPSYSFFLTLFGAIILVLGSVGFFINTKNTQINGI